MLNYLFEFAAPQGSALQHDWYHKPLNRMDRNKKSTEWDQEGGSHPATPAMLRGQPRMPASISFLTGHRAGAGSLVLDTPAWQNHELKEPRPIRD